MSNPSTPSTGEHSVIVSGFGGQGTLFAGQLLAYAAMEAGKEVTWFPAYGPESRGGKARCTVIVSDEPIGAPVIRRPRSCIALNLPSMEGFEPEVLPGGTLVVNTSLVKTRSERDDIQVLYVPATADATKLGNPRLANVIALGALVEANGIVPLDAIIEALRLHLPERHKKLLGLNVEAIQHGATYAHAG